MRAAVPQQPPKFRWETDLAEPVLAWCAREWPNAAIGEELPAEWASPDIVAGAPSTLLDPALALTSVEQISLAMASERGSLLTRAELRERSSLSWVRYQREILEPLVRRGAIRETGPDWRGGRRLSPPYSRLIAIELKLSDWRRAFVQAHSYALFADFTYVALPAARVTKAVLTELTAERTVGLLGVGDSVEVLVRPRRQSDHDRVLRQLVMERLVVASAREPQRRAGSAGNVRVAYV